MIQSLLLSSLAFFSATELAAVNPRQSAARVLELALAPTIDGEEPGLPLLLEGGRTAASALGGGAFAETIDQAVLDARWRAVTDSELARERLAQDLRRAADDLNFAPLLEAELPAGFPPPTPVREIELKEYPGYRMVRADMRGRGSNQAFWRLFSHIKKHDIAMTAPVEMTYGDERDALDETEMAFLYGSPDMGEVGQDGAVEVIDAEAALVASLGCRGRMTRSALDAARTRLVAWIEARDDLEVAGELRSMGYNSPMVPNSKRYFEVQIPVRKVERTRPENFVLDFSDETEARRWSIVNDSVMGGLSTSRIRPTAEGTVVFAGRVSLDNNGGFASVRRRPADMELDGARELLLAFRGDGQTYKLRVRTDGAYDGVNYEVRFATEDGVWMEKSFPIEDFVPVWRGRLVRSAPPLDASRIQSVGFMISDKQEGTFRLEVASLARD